MAGEKGGSRDEEREPLTRGSIEFRDSINSFDYSSSTASLSLAVIDRINGSTQDSRLGEKDQRDDDHDQYRNEEEYDVEDADYIPSGGKTVQKTTKIVLWALLFLCVGGWSLAFVIFLFRGHDTPQTSIASEENISSGGARGNRITLDEVLGGEWAPRAHSISWFPGPNGEDGLILEKDNLSATAYLRVEDIVGRKDPKASKKSIVLMQKKMFTVGRETVYSAQAWPSPDLKTVLVLSDQQKNWRHSFTGKYWLFDVETQTGQPLDPGAPDRRIQLASWSPQSDAVVFTRDNNMFLRKLTSNEVATITTDGGVDLFYGVPDWVYEEEVFSGNSATWWASDGDYIAFLRTNESSVPDYPIQYFASRPSGENPKPGEENYPEVREVKYPKAGAPNPIVDLQFYDVGKGEVFSVDVTSEFADDDRLIIEVLWASNGKALVRETNRESDILSIAIIDVLSRTGRIVRREDVNALDGGWVEPTQSTRFIPADPDHGRLDDGYIDTVIYEGRDQLAYFTPLDNPKPIMLTKGHSEVVNAPSGVDLKRGLVYFVVAGNEPWERHIYSVNFDGTSLQPLTNVTESSYYDVSFSNGAGYALLNYRGPKVPWQKVINTPANENSFEAIIEQNDHLSRKLRLFSLESKVYQHVTVDGFSLPVMERRPPNFDPAKKYPVLFHLYGGPGSQTVSKKFSVDFQSYVASTLGYIVVTVDGRGTGHIGRKARCIIRGNLGHYEARDQIETAKKWAAKPYVDESRMAIWGWSYGGFMTLKTLEQDGGRTFQYGMAVAPVTDWRYYDSIYTERYMRTPQHNQGGYDTSAISNTTALASNIRFLLMHGTADDNVHIQNSLTLLDKLDLDDVDNYDVHVFPDSDHSIYFHNAHKMVYNRLGDWLINAFNGEWLKVHKPTPNNSLFRRAETWGGLPV
ncbi:hypothetical protein RJZ56_001299 [Blastomyces dermatitidis]|uniref:Probable dipeptidyl-aminopeptidase B n=3 Tax=Blastomyces TaxID=229219 RepID=DAPB_BLAGS|nr:dipeptidyl aminopeptidase [Blastomyces gilchristii SLH14081]XP_045273096.1 dipeptidyl aminopeptidase [Blastomyces dermatitidis ER-3]C5GVF3.1 RecName: Full=Probable dipeptidyl-aminopeptidase B; Short=DPAP B [Blastomyces dermatitidis ER-3]C5JC30.1 RecName: Full=Probable dipeptidyl-aminopeptidase B; Short=DPAP B [Blastomyces gilchristii SLH14081]EGE78382.1 dipeptidyl aminopeptidase [Blastomyces dermatitidis ATCC 18188]EEQ85314.1 dipeptidyl aminopeptidase [Blastomyces dermatitidis ER-3]OAT0336